jgi:hypothetical protein
VDGIGAAISARATDVQFGLAATASATDRLRPRWSGFREAGQLSADRELHAGVEDILPFEGAVVRNGGPQVGQVYAT